MAEDFAKLTRAQQQVLLDGPAISPPIGIAPNFTDPERHYSLSWGVLITSAALSAIAVSIRLYTRIFCIRKLRIEDYIMLAALGLFAGALYSLFRLSVSPGFYVHSWNIRLKDMAGVLYNANAVSILYAGTIMGLKVAILLEWIHIFVPYRHHNSFFWVCRCAIWVNVCFYVIGTFLNIFACHPIEKLWDKLIPGGTCLNVIVMWTASSVFNLVSDIIILIVPQKVIWGLQMSTEKKGWVSAVFLIGISTCICAAVRCYYAVKLLNAKDEAYALAPEGLLGLAEMTAGFVILGAPSIPKAVNNTMLLHRCKNLIEICSASFRSRPESNSKRSLLPQWYKSRVLKKEQQISNDGPDKHDPMQREVTLELPEYSLQIERTGHQEGVDSF